MCLIEEEKVGESVKREEDKEPEMMDYTFMIAPQFQDIACHFCDDDNKYYEPMLDFIDDFLESNNVSGDYEYISIEVVNGKACVFLKIDSINMKDAVQEAWNKYYKETFDQ